MSSYFEAGQDSITFLFPGQEENNQTIRYADLGWSPEQIRYHVAFPSFSQADFILLADLICYGDERPASGSPADRIPLWRRTLSYGKSAICTATASSG